MSVNEMVRETIIASLVKKYALTDPSEIAWFQFWIRPRADRIIRAVRQGRSAA